MSGDLLTPRWLADEMLGRLARYLRFFGHDTAYVRGLPDEWIRELAAAENRTLLTRDRALAHRTDGALLILATEIRAQIREVANARPSAGFVPTFDRCPECNGRLVPYRAGAGPSPPYAVAGPIFRCPGCERWYWDGSHTTRIRSFVREALASVEIAG